MAEVWMDNETGSLAIVFDRKENGARVTHNGMFDHKITNEELFKHYEMLSTLH